MKQYKISLNAILSVDNDKTVVTLQIVPNIMNQINSAMKTTARYLEWMMSVAGIGLMLFTFAGKLSVQFLSTIGNSENIEME